MNNTTNPAYVFKSLSEWMQMFIAPPVVVVFNSISQCNHGLHMPVTCLLLQTVNGVQSLKGATRCRFCS